MNVITSPVIVKEVSYVLEKIMANVNVESANACQAGPVSPVIAGQQMKHVFLLVEGKSVLARVNANAEHANVLKERKGDILADTVKNVR